MVQSTPQSDWQETTLGEAVNLVGGGTPKTTIEKYWNGDIPWLSVVDFNNDNRWTDKTEKKITKKGLENSSTTLLKEGDLIISARGTVGALAQLKIPMAFNQSCYGIREKEGISENDFLYYLTKFSLGQFLKNAHGAVFDTITKQTFDNIKISLPPLPEQHAIAVVLSAFDEKIELLRKQNQTLEAIAQNIFKEWFVGFKFPGYEKVKMVDSELGEIPEGWRIGKIGDIVDIKQGKYVKAEEISSSVSGNKKYPIYGANGIRGYTSDFMYETPKVVFGCRGLCGFPKFSEQKSSITNTCMALENEKGTLSSAFLYFWSKRVDFESVTSGSAQPQITITNFSTLEIMIPESEILEKFNRIVKPTFSKIQENNSQIQTLSTLRDTLLPRLMRGEVRVKDLSTQ